MYKMLVSEREEVSCGGMGGRNRALLILILASLVSVSASAWSSRPSLILASLVTTVTTKSFFPSLSNFQQHDQTASNRCFLKTKFRLSETFNDRLSLSSWEMTERASGVAETTTTTTAEEDWVRTGQEDLVKVQDTAKELQLKQHYMRVNVDLIKGVVEEVIVNIVEKEQERRNRSKEARWMRKLYKRIG